MLFFDQPQLARMSKRFGETRWPGYDESFLFQPAPQTVAGKQADFYEYEVLRFNGKVWERVRTEDLKFAVWVVTENAVAYALSGDKKHLHNATAWVRALLTGSSGAPSPAGSANGNTDLFFGDMAYAVAMFYDLCANDIDGDLRLAIEERLYKQALAGYEYFHRADPHTYRFTQNHVFTAFVGFLCAAFALRHTRPETETWIRELSPFVELIIGSLGTDGFYFEGLGYAYYSFMWIMRMAELWQRHMGKNHFSAPCFARLQHFLHWMMFPQGKDFFWIANSSEKYCAFASWDEYRQREGLRTDVDIQNCAYMLYRIALATGDMSHKQVADAILARGFRWIEGFWALAWECPAGTQPEPPMPAQHHFPDFGVWAHDSQLPQGVLRVVAKSGPPMGHSLKLKEGKPVYRCDPGHVHPDAGSIFAAINDVPLLIAPGYTGRKSGAYENTLTFDGQGQGEDRIWNAFGYDYTDFLRLSQLRLEVDAGNPHQVRMEIGAGYDPELGVLNAVRSVECLGDRVHINDSVQTKGLCFPEARFRVSDPPYLPEAHTLCWNAGGHSAKLRIVSSSVPLRIFFFPGEVVQINQYTPSRAGAFAEGKLAQRGFQVLIRPIEKQRKAEWCLELSIQ